MAYVALQDFLDTPHGAEMLAELAPNGSGSYESAKVTEAIEKADGIINDYLSGRYTVPVTTTAGIRVRALAIAWYLLFPQGRPDHVREDYLDAIKYFEMVAKGLINLAVDGGGTVTVTGGVLVSSDARQFTNSDLALL
jgi:phage gp36-like protein